jgi:hypothetical protein
MSRLILRTPLVAAALALVLALVPLTTPLAAGASAAGSGTVTVTATVNPSIRMVLSEPTNGARVISAVAYELSVGSPLELAGSSAADVCYTVVQR